MDLDISRTFYCPHCKRAIAKNEQLTLLCYLYQEGKELPLNRPAHIPCTFTDCGQKIKATEIFSGKHDYPPVPGFYFKKHLGEVCLVAIVISVLILKFVFHWAFIAAFFVGMIGGVVIGGMITPALDKISLAFRKR